VNPAVRPHRLENPILEERTSLFPGGMYSSIVDDWIISLLLPRMMC